MSGTYLTSLADWLRDAGLNVVEYDGWKSRARSSGGYTNGRPWGIMWHHTASSTSPQNDASYMCNGSSDRPIANLLITRDGGVWVLAAGATNTNGKGGPWTWSRGVVAADQMNLAAVGMELANAGTGEAYPSAQIDAAFGASIAIGKALGLASSDLCQHQSWAPSRKIDPAAAAGVQGSWRPSSCTSSGTWEQADTIAEHVRRWSAAPAPTPQEDDDMAPACVYLGTELHVFTRGDDCQLWHQWYANGKWSNEGLGGQLASSPAAAARPLDDGHWRVDVTAQGNDGDLWQVWYDGAKWSGWVKVSSWPGA